jgi:centrosomal protein CEP104
MVEISGLNYHFQSECKFAKEFKVCQRCKEPYHQNEYNNHVAEKHCIPAKNPNVANRCPLCHTDHTPAGKVGWETHLLQNTCPNNPRSFG